MLVSLVRAGLVLGMLSANFLGIARTAQSGPSAMQVVRLCVSAPVGTPQLHVLAKGMFDAVVLATQDWKQVLRRANKDVGGPLEMDDSPVTLGGERERANAARCLADTHAIAYIGPLNSQAAAASEPLLNRAGMPQISPSTTQPLLTSPRTRAALEPSTFNGTLKYVTFYRVIADDQVQGGAMAAYLVRARKARSFFSLDDSSVYGAGLMAASGPCAAALGLRIVGKTHLNAGSSHSLTVGTRAVAGLIAALRPDGVLYGGGPEPIADLAGQLQRDGYRGPIVGGDALRADPMLPPRVALYHSVEVISSNIGPDPGAIDKRFNDRFRRRFGYWPPMYTALAYDAAATVYQAVLDSQLVRARRSGLLPYIRFVNRMGVTGRIRFDRNGDTLTRTVSLYVAHHGRWLYASTAPDCRVGRSRP